MSTKELTKEAMALPLAERIALAQSLWQSIEGQPAIAAGAETEWAVGEAMRRDHELSSGKAIGRTHDQVMRTARQALE